MSYELKIDPRKRVAARLIGAVRKALISAAMDERDATGLTQQAIADRLGVHRSFVTKLLKNEGNLTLRSIADLAWALGYQPNFSLDRNVPLDRCNNTAQVTTAEEHVPAANQSPRPFYVHSGESVNAPSRTTRVLETSH